jgi:hypothetical protein
VLPEKPIGLMKIAHNPNDLECSVYLKRRNMSTKTRKKLIISFSILTLAMICFGISIVNTFVDNSRNNEKPIHIEY